MTLIKLGNYYIVAEHVSFCTAYPDDDRIKNIKEHDMEFLTPIQVHFLMGNSISFNYSYDSEKITFKEYKCFLDKLKKIKLDIKYI